MKRNSALKREYAASLALLALAAAGALALLSYFNSSQWAVNATLAPVSKNLNQSVYPLARAWFQFAGPYNVTYYYVKFMPGWPESYTVGIFAARDSGWRARLEVVGRSGSPGGPYSISLGGQAQITNTQDAGPYVSTTAPLVWSMATTGRYSILAAAQFNKGGIYATQLVNFTAEPMSKLASWTFSCPGYTYTYTPTCTGSTPYSDPLAYSTQPGYITPYTRYDSTTVTSPVQYTGPSIRTQIDTQSNNTAGISAVIYNVAARWGAVPAGGAVVQVTGTYTRDTNDAQNNVAYLSIGIDTTGDGSPDVEYIAYVWDVTTGYTGSIYSVIVGQGTLVATVDSNGDYSLQTASTAYQLVKVQSVTSGTTFTIRVVLPSTLSGRIVSVAMAVVDPSGYADGSPKDDFWVDWTNLYIYSPCSNSPQVSPYNRGAAYTSVFITPSNTLVTEVDAYSNTGYIANDYGLAAALVNYVFNATSASISVTATYYRDAADIRNNVVYVDVAVDENYDGAPDREYIYYYYDTADGNGVIVSPFTRAVVCTVSSAGACSPSNARYVVQSPGTPINSDRQSLAFSISIPLTARGAATSIALAVTDASGYVSRSIYGDIVVEWGPLTVKSYSCPLPSGWYNSTAPGAYVWQTNYALFLANGATAYTQKVDGALTYVANFTGVGKYVVLTSTLGDAFGLYLRASFTTGCVYGYYSSSSRYVELRPLAALGDVIVRDSAGNVLARFGCTAPPNAQYIGFKTGAGECLIVRLVEAWG